MKIWLTSILVCLTLGLHAQDEWWKETTVYQIYPRSFQDSDGDGIGDLNGIISRLDYIQDLGFDAIWISPFFKSPQGDFGYDVSDYRSIAPEYGDMATCERLIREIHQRDMKIIFDLVMNHTSDQHEWFQNSRSSIDAEKRDWYIWRDGKRPNGKKPPNNWKSMIGGSGWHYDETTGQWYWATFLPFQPDLNYHNPEVKKAMLDVARFWLDKGVDGFRLDIFNTIYEDASFENNPFSLKMIPDEENPNGYFQKVENTQNHPQSFAFAQELRALLDEYSEPKYTVGEVFGDASTLKRFCGENDKEGLHSVFLFKTLTTKMKAKHLAKMINEFEEVFPTPYLPTYVYSNHDKVRSISRHKGNIEIAKLQALMQHTIRGIPFTYYGEELGMPQSHIPLKEGKDPLAKKYEKVPQFLVNLTGQSLNRDECRTPMLWDSTANAGFTTADAKPWLPISDSHDDINLAIEENDANSLYSFYKRLLAFRKTESWMIQADMFVAHRHGILSYTRTKGDKQALVFLNFTNKPKKVALDKDYSPMFSTHELPVIKNRNLELQPHQGVVLMQ